MRVLVVEDSPKLLAVVSGRLRGAGYAVDGAATGRQALEWAVATSYDAIVLDLRLPDMDGLEVCRRLRAAERWSPILMLTSRDGVADRVDGLDAGGDDYLVKPFAFPELFARVRALTRREPGRRPSVLAVGDLRLDPAARTVQRGADAIELTAKEFGLLEVFMRHPGVVLGRRRLVADVWDGCYDGDSNLVDVYVRNLRTKIDRPYGRHTLETVRGIGYRLADDAAAGRPT